MSRSCYFKNLSRKSNTFFTLSEASNRGSPCPAPSSSSNLTLFFPSTFSSLDAKWMDCWIGTVSSCVPCCRKKGGSRSNVGFRIGSFHQIWNSSNLLSQEQGFRLIGPTVLHPYLRRHSTFRQLLVHLEEIRRAEPYHNRLYIARPIWVSQAEVFQFPDSRGYSRHGGKIASGGAPHAAV